MLLHLSASQTRTIVTLSITCMDDVSDLLHPRDTDDIQALFSAAFATLRRIARHSLAVLLLSLQLCRLHLLLASKAVSALLLWCNDARTDTWGLVHKICCIPRNAVRIIQEVTAPPRLDLEEPDVVTDRAVDLGSRESQLLELGELREPEIEPSPASSCMDSKLSTTTSVAEIRSRMQSIIPRPNPVQCSTCEDLRHELQQTRSVDDLQLPTKTPSHLPRRLVVPKRSGKLQKRPPRKLLERMSQESIDANETRKGWAPAGKA